MSPDPASLDNLHDLAVPSPAPWWPPAPGWAVLMAIGGWVLIVLIVRAAICLRQNRYRREALAELKTTTAVPELVKRVALAAYPRTEVAELSGEPWLAFLGRTGGTTAFTRGPGRALADLAYRPDPGPPTPELLAVVRLWIRHHRPTAR